MSFSPLHTERHVPLRLTEPTVNKKKKKEKGIKNKTKLKKKQTKKPEPGIPRRYDVKRGKF